MKDNKGMTLIEVVVSLLILSTASLIMVMGFTTAIHTFSDANEYKNAINKEESVLQGDTTYSEEVSIADQDVKYSITVNSGETPIEVKATLKKATTSLENASLSSIELGNTNTDDTKKARNIYKNCCNMMKELGEYLKNNGVKETDTINSKTCKDTIARWINEKTGKNVKPFEIMVNVSKLYSLIYPDIELGTLPAKIEKVNKNFDSNKNIYATPCMYVSQDTVDNMLCGTFFFGNGADQEPYYKENIYILVGTGKHGIDGNRPTDMWAVYDNNTLSDDTDTWLIPKQKVSVDEITDKPYKSFYSSLDRNKWVRYTTIKQ